MDRVVRYFVRRHFRLEIKRPETAFATALRIELWIQIQNPIGRGVDNSQVRITGTLDTAFNRSGEVTFKSRDRVEVSTQQVFEVAARFVDPSNSLHSVVRLIYLAKHAIQNAGDSFNDALIGRIVEVERDDLFPRRIENDLPKWNLPQVLILVEQPRDQFVNPIALRLGNNVSSNEEAGGTEARNSERRS